MKRVTFQQPESRKLEPTQHAVLADRGARIFRTGGLKTTSGPKERRNPVSITGKQSQTALAHVSPHEYEAAVGAEVTTAMPLSKRQRAEQSNPSWERTQDRAPEAIVHAADE